MLKNKSAFSLIEVMITVLILSVALIVLAPIVTNKTVGKQNDGVVFTYNDSNRVQTNNLCFFVSNGTNTSSRDCSQYNFTVPRGVNKVNITLVAGGGGGGGAGGGRQFVQAASSTQINLDLLKKVKINLLTAKGTDGTKFTSTSATPQPQKGGKSSPAIVDFDIPFDLLRGTAYTNALSAAATSGYVLANSTDASLKIGQGNNTSSLTQLYGIAISSTYALSCTGGSTVDACRLTEGKNYFPSKEGKDGAKAIESGKVYSNMVLAGGAGGKTDGVMGSYGSGGMGASVKYTCTSGTTCNYSASTRTSANNSITGGSAFVSATVIQETPGRAGFGGAGGSAIRITGFPVISGHTYRIVVGKGGRGGKGGISSSSPSGGIGGAGGVSSAIYDGDNLIYMVNGGIGGQGGTAGNTSTNTPYLNGVVTDNSRYFPTLTSGDSNFLNGKFFDDNKTDIVSDTNATPTLQNAQTQARRIAYSFISNEPFTTFINGKNRTTDNKLGGFNGFDNGTNTGYQNATIDDDTTLNNAYDGFYYKTLIDQNLSAYVGGLGGFSGLGTKAGCGGYFMGNLKGLFNSGSSSSDSLKNKFIINSKLYRVSDYYDNCTIDNPNGQSATFVVPNPKTSSLGQAGSGGGGGGYSLKDGAGNGGDGQNGYVMIQWKI